MSAVIDVHTHMLNDRWLDTILEHGGRYSLKELVSNIRTGFRHGP